MVAVRLGEGVGGGQRSLLLLLQGMDTSGKDGSVRRVVGSMNPAGVRITSFKKPTDEELAKARRRHGWDLRALNDTTEELAAFHAVGHLFDRHESLEERRAANEAVTKEQLRALAAEIAQPHRLTAVAVGLLDDGEDGRFRHVVEGWRGA